ncbi:unnamed protein product (macronuclear) [Paramecium tetraurelia]|uniref:Importin N-terminal domain-containing protein n=1 Tax=Paramecium tetraurelia TaxID=5888 RepID=A0CHN3_PARTE|nr:uncharacterized protein GSPATT00038402001 [Paramecium tetraurelia]CAK70300.1 unnamed protein product [Paramecium tetraurelia]|eukprot:XP_001437697.1 hypothetical protein (macronuclear) [Paramecium tetraurelia strain d4-2]
MLNNIYERIIVAYTSIDQNQRISAEKDLNQLEEQDANLCGYLLELIQTQQQNSQIKFFTIIHLKNVIKRRWKAFKQMVGCEKRQNYFAENQKNQIKELVLQFYCQEQVGQLKQEILQILYEVCSSDYPFKYPLLLKYINQQLEANNLDEQLLSFLKQIFKIMPKNQQKNEQYNCLWQKIASLWVRADNLNNYSQQSLLLLDKMFTNFILSYHSNVFKDEIQQIFSSMLQKIAILLQSDTQQQYHKNITHLISKCSKLVANYPFQLTQNLPDYLQMLSVTINSNKKIITKGGLISFIRFLKLSQLFLTDDLLLLNMKKYSDQEKQQVLKEKQVVDTIIKQFFEKESQNFIQRFLTLITSSNEISIEDMIEQEEENEFEKILHPKDAEIFSLALIAAELLIVRAPSICSNLLQGYIDQTIQAQFQINPNVLESLLIIIGLIPKIQSKLKFQFQIQYPTIIQYLQTSNQLHHQRRLSILLNRLILILDQNQILSSLQVAGNLLSTSQDSIIQYQSLLCIKQVAVNYNGSIQWSQILVTVCPYIVALLKCLKRTTIITPLLDLLSKLIEKCQNEQTEVVVSAIENSGLFQLMQSKFQEAEENLLIIDQVCQMLKTLIIAYPLGTKIPHIFQMALVLIVNNINSKQACILELTLLLLREYEEQQQNFPIDQLISILQQNLDSLLSDTSQINSCIIISIIEELYLLNTFSVNDFSKHIPYMESRYSLRDTNVKNSVLGLTTTMILMLLNNNRQDIAIFSGLIQVILNDLLEPEMNEILENKFRIEIQIVSILNRFIILARDNFFSFVQQNSISFEKYLQSWMKKSEILESEKSIKLNVIAFLLIIDYVQPTTFIQYFTQIATQYARFSKKQFIQKTIAVLTPNQRLSQHRASNRKEKIRNTQMHNEHNLQQYFKQMIQDYILKHNLSQDLTVIQALQMIS